MNTADTNRQHLRKMLDAIINEDGETAKAAFHDYVVDRSKSILEMHEDKKPVGGEGKKDPKSEQGAADVKASMKKPTEIKASGESKDDPKAAKGAEEVKSSMKKGKEIPKKGESKPDPTAAKGAEEVKSTMKKASSDDITAKKS